MVKLEQLKSNVVNPNQRQQLTDNERIKIKLQHLNEDGHMGKDFHLREHIEETNSSVLDRYDSFYRETKSLLVLFQIMGVVPISRTSHNGSGPRTTFSWLSRATLWAYFVFSIESILVLLVFRARLMDFMASTDRRFDVIIHQIIFISILLVHFLLPFASWRNTHKVADFKNTWTHFQVKYVQIMGTPVEFSEHAKLTWTSCVVSWVASVAFVLAECYLQDDFPWWHTFAYYHIISTLNCFCGLWYINCEAFIFISRLVIKNLTHAINTKDSAHKIAEFRNLWLDLSRTMGKLARVNGNVYSLYLMMIFFMTIIATYGALSEIIDHGFTYKEIGMIIIVCYCMCILFIICNQAHHASTEVGYNFQEYLFHVDLMHTSEPVKREIEMFLVAIQKNPPVMNLNGYADVDRGLITSSITFICTYLLVLMQFKMSLVATSASSSPSATSMAAVD